MRKKIISFLKIIGLHEPVRGLLERNKYAWHRTKYPLWLYLLQRPRRPLSEAYGCDRGKAVDRYYIEQFIHLHRNNIAGKCLEINDARYIKKFGQNVAHVDILDIDRTNLRATIYGDLRTLTNVADNTYDCIILTQVLQYIDDVNAATREIFRILKPGGVVLATMPSISRIDVRAGIDGDFWRFTAAGAQHLFGTVFDKKNIKVAAYGNSYAGMLFWIGASQEEVNKKKLNYSDPNFPILISVRAVKHVT